MYTTLADILSQQVEVLADLVQLGQAKTEALTQDDPVTLERIALQEAAKAQELEGIEEQRHRLITALEQQAADLTGQRIELTLGDFISLAPAPWNERLEELQTQLTTLVTEIKETMEFNHRLLLHSLALVNFSLEVLTGGEEEAATYGKPGEGKGVQKTAARVLDAKA